MAFAHTSKAKTHFFENSDLKQVLHSRSQDEEEPFVKTKVAFTIGSASRSVEHLCEILEAGATCARIDLTWNSLQYHKKSLHNLIEAMKITRRLCAVLVDIQGREITINRPEVRMDNDGVHRDPDATLVEAGSTVILTTDLTQKFSSEIFPVRYSRFPQMVEPGDNIFVGRYLVSGADASSLYLRVDSCSATEVVCTALSSAVLSGLLTVFHTERSDGSVANLQNDLPPLTESDRTALRVLTAEFDIDFVAVAYCREADDVEEVRAYLRSIDSRSTKVLAKCETRQGLFHFRHIAVAADGIIMSRGNLGLDVPPEKTAMVQKAIVSACNVLGKPCLITRVVDTMIVSPRPTRAEATDIANAVLDGVDGIMLGAETYRGEYALEAVRTVIAIACEAEAVFDHKGHFDHLLDETGRFAASGVLATRALREDLLRYTSAASLQDAAPRAAAPSIASSDVVDRLGKLEAVASSAVRAADKVGAGMIIVVTQQGSASKLVAKYRPAMPIMTLVVPYLKRDGLHWKLEGRSTARQALITSGLMPVLAAPMPNPGQGESLIEEAVVLAVQQGIIKPHDHVVTISRAGATEFMVKIVSVNEYGNGIKLIRPKSLVNILRSHDLPVPPGLIDDVAEELDEQAERNGELTTQDAARVHSAGAVAGEAVRVGAAPPAPGPGALATADKDETGALTPAPPAVSFAPPTLSPSHSMSSPPKLGRTSVLIGHNNDALVLQGSSLGSPSLSRASSSVTARIGKGLASRVSGAFKHHDQGSKPKA